MNGQQTDARLTELLEELATCRGHEDEAGPSFDERLGVTRAALFDLPLVHGTRHRQIGSILDERILLSRRQVDARLRRREPKPHHTLFETHDSVYTALGVLYPERDIALVFAPACEEGRQVTASPWDSGALFWLCENGHLPGRDAGATFRRYTLPAPTYRSYFVHYVATCFDAPRDYLRGGAPRLEDPIGVFGIDDLPIMPIMRSFEVRIADRLPVEAGSLQAIFFSTFYSTRLEDHLVEFKAAGVHVEPVHAVDHRPADLRGAVIEWVEARCGARAERGDR